MNGLRAPSAAVVDDLVLPGGLAARDVGFAIPERYNACRILFANLANGNAGRIAVRSAERTLTCAALCEEAYRAGRMLLLLNDTPA